MDKFIIIDRENLKFVGVGCSMQIASLMAWNDHPNIAVLILPLEAKRYFAQLSRMELMMLYKNETGENGSLFEVPALIERLHQIADLLPVDKRSFTGLSKASEGLPEMIAPPTVWKPEGHRADPTQQYASRPVAPAEARPKAPRDPSAKPSPRGATGKVWDIADRVWQENGNGLITKELRTKIIVACEAEGIHPATAATQYSKWKATK